MILTRKQVMIVFGGVLALIVVLVVIFLNFRGGTKGAGAITLTIWGTDDQKTMSDILEPYTSGDQRNNKITYVSIPEQDYEKRLLAAFAAGQGPDIFEIGNRDLPKWQNLLASVPAQIQPPFNLITLEGSFPTAVEQDFVADGQIYALPLGVDTLGLIYNKNLFDSAGIVFPPKTWEDFQNDVSKLRIMNAAGQITQAGAAIGGSAKSIANAADIVFLLMLQNGTQMTSSDFSSVTFATGATGDPGIAAFKYYLQFANPSSPYYTWSDGMGDALQSFIQGKTAMIFDYANAIPTIKAKAPFLNIGVAPVPQPTGATVSVNYPKYKGFAVSRRGNVLMAWNFLIALTANVDNGKIYANAAGGIPALRSSIGDALNDPTLAPFATQVLTARSWHETDDTQMSSIMSAAIQNVLAGALEPERALNEAQAAMNQIQ